jgi:hypothetical protein
MDFQLRIIFLIIGMLVLFGVTIDFIRRRQIKQSPDANFDHDAADSQLLRSAMLNEDQYTDVLQHEPDLEDGLELGLDIYGEYAEKEALEPENLDLDLGVEQESVLSPVELSAAEVIVIFIMARDQIGFRGKALADALASAHLYIGKNQIFYRAENEDGTGEHLFTLASAIEPGYFDAVTFKYETFQGVTLIMLPSKVQNPVSVLDKLIRTAKQLSFALNGELLDHTRQPLTLTTIDSYKAQIQKKQ